METSGTLWKKAQLHGFQHSTEANLKMPKKPKLLSISKIIFGLIFSFVKVHQKFCEISVTNSRGEWTGARTQRLAEGKKRFMWAVMSNDDRFGGTL